MPGCLDAVDLNYEDFSKELLLSHTVGAKLEMHSIY